MAALSCNINGHPLGQKGSVPCQPSCAVANAVEPLHRNLPKTIEKHGSFPSEEAALKLLHLAMTLDRLTLMDIQVNPCAAHARVMSV